MTEGRWVDAVCERCGAWFVLERTTTKLPLHLLPRRLPYRGTPQWFGDGPPCSGSGEPITAR